jgi:hypothetical protein
MLLWLGAGVDDGNGGVAEEIAQRGMDGAGRFAQWPPCRPGPATECASAVGVDGVVCVQVRQGTDGTHEAFGDVTVIDDIPGEHHIEQVR